MNLLPKFLAVNELQNKQKAFSGCLILGFCTGAASASVQWVLYSPPPSNAPVISTGIQPVFGNSTANACDSPYSSLVFSLICYYYSGYKFVDFAGAWPCWRSRFHYLRHCCSLFRFPTLEVCNVLFSLILFALLRIISFPPYLNTITREFTPLIAKHLIRKNLLSFHVFLTEKGLCESANASKLVSAT